MKTQILEAIHGPNKSYYGKASGGTGQAMRAAEHFNIPIFNLYFDSTLDELEVS